MFIAAAIAGVGAIAGASASRSAAKDARAAQEHATEASMEAFRFSQPYIRDSYDSAGGFNQDVLNAGAYGGQTLAGTNPYQTSGNYMMARGGMRLAPQAFGIAQTGGDFASNYGDLFRQSQQDRMSTANQYAMDNSQPLVDSIMRDDYRNLTENTLTGINMGASGTGNMNSSRAGVADAVARRSVDDRRADVTTNIQDSLRRDSLNQQNRQFSDAMNANAGLRSAYTDGLNAFGATGDMAVGAGGNLRAFEQQQLDDARAAFERDRDFAFNQQAKYQQGILGNAVYNNPTVQPNLYNPNMATFGGAMQGAGTFMDMYKDYKTIKGMNASGGGTTV